MPDEYKSPVEINGGMTKDQIKNELMERDKVWSSKMDELSEQFERRLEVHTDKLDRKAEFHADKLEKKLETFKEANDLRLGAQDEKLEKILSVVTRNAENHERWHEDDILYRKGIEDWKSSQEPKIDRLIKQNDTTESKINDANTKLNILRYFVSISTKAQRVKAATVKIRDSTVKIAETGKQFAAWIASFIGAILLLWQTIKGGGIWDTIKAAWKTHHKIP